MQWTSPAGYARHHSYLAAGDPVPGIAHDLVPGVTQLFISTHTWLGVPGTRYIAKQTIWTTGHILDS